MTEERTVTGGYRVNANVLLGPLGSECLREMANRSLGRIVKRLRKIQYLLRTVTEQY